MRALSDANNFLPRSSGVSESSGMSRITKTAGNTTSAERGIYTHFIYILHLLLEGVNSKGEKCLTNLHPF